MTSPGRSEHHVGLRPVLAVFLYQGDLDTGSALTQIIALTASVYLAGALLVVSLAATEGSAWHRVFSSWPLRQVGQYSYAIYLLHYPLAYVLDRSGVVQRGAFDAHFSSWLGAELAYVGTMVLLSLLAGAASWHLYEKHFLRLRRYLPYGLGTRAG